MMPKVLLLSPGPVSVLVVPRARCSALAGWDPSTWLPPAAVLGSSSVG